MLFHVIPKSSNAFMGEIPYSDYDFEEEIKSSGQEVQRLSVLSSLPELLKENYDMCFRRIIPKIREVVRVATIETQRVAGAVFLEILQRNLVPIQTYSQTFLPTVLLGMDNRDPELSTAWLETLLSIMELLPKEIISREVLHRAVAKGQLSQPVASRLASCQILACAAPKFTSVEVKREILSVVLSLCQDVEYEVRACMSRLLCPVAQVLGMDETKTSILPELVELTKDEKIEVRLAGLDTLVSILPLMDNEAKVSTVIPIFSNYCSQALEERDVTLSAIAQHFGSLCEALQSNFTEDQTKEFLDLYKRLCRIHLSKKAPNELQETKQPKPSFPTLMYDFEDQKDEEEDEFEKCRQFAAYNLPTMINFVGPKVFRTELSAMFAQISADNNVHVREKIASRFHEIAKLVGSSSHSVVADSLIKLLQDDHFEVLSSGLIQDLPKTLAALSKAPNSEAKMSEVLAAIGSRRDFIMLSRNWRLQEQYFTMLSCLPPFFTSDQIYQNIISVMYPKLRMLRALPVRRALLQTLLMLLRHNVRQDQREKMFGNILKDYGCGRSCFQRSLFIDGCRMALELYSRSFFKEWFFQPLVALHKDTVPNVRLRLCALLPLLKALLKKPVDAALIDLLDNCILDLRRNEEDVDVKEAVDKAYAGLSEILVPFESQLIKSKEDKADDLKLAEERKWTEMEEQNKKPDEVSKETKKKLAVGAVVKGSKLPMPAKAAVSTAKDKQPTTNNSTPSSQALKDPKRPLGGPARSASNLTSLPSSASSPAVPPSSGAASSANRRIASSVANQSGSSIPGSKGRVPGQIENKKIGNASQRRTSLDNSAHTEASRKK